MIFCCLFLSVLLLFCDLLRTLVTLNVIFVAPLRIYCAFGNFLLLIFVIFVRCSEKSFAIFSRSVRDFFKWCAPRIGAKIIMIVI